MLNRDLTLSDNALLKANGYRILVRGTLTMSTGSRISNDGVSFSVGAPSGTVGGGGDGEQNVDPALGGSGSGTTASPPDPAEGSDADIRNAAQAATGRLASGAIHSGGSGGSDLGSSGGGGVVIVAAQALVGPPSGSALITADGAGDGGGGVVVVVSQSAKPSSVTL